MKKYFSSFIFHLSSRGGFTLVEILASVVVLVAVGSIIAGITASSLRGTNKTNMIENIRQSGNYTLNQISKDIAYAQSFDGSSTGFNFDSVTNIYLTSCPTLPTLLTDITVRSASNGNIVTKYDCNDSALAANGNSLVDDSTTLISCSFTCTQANPSTDVPMIGISFALGPKSPNSLPENNQQSSILFKTSVIMRNYRR
ncbi:MAG: hypothetical protein HW400_281 [Candidatus Levybacteria bacterium]|nr:hypothetical protein [Candidatus Levybacteria bacterium]